MLHSRQSFCLWSTIDICMCINVYACGYWTYTYVQIEKKTINSQRYSSYRIPHANVLCVCHMRIRSMDRSMTNILWPSKRRKVFYDDDGDDEWSMSTLIHLLHFFSSSLLSLLSSLLVEECYSSRRDQTFFIYWFVLKSSSRLKFTLLSRDFDCVSISN